MPKQTVYSTATVLHVLIATLSRIMFKQTDVTFLNL